MWSTYIHVEYLPTTCLMQRKRHSRESAALYSSYQRKSHILPTSKLTSTSDHPSLHTSYRLRLPSFLPSFPLLERFAIWRSRRQLLTSHTRPQLLLLLHHRLQPSSSLSQPQPPTTPSPPLSPSRLTVKGEASTTYHHQQLVVQGPPLLVKA